MNFKRATTSKQRESRREAIIDATLVIYLQDGFSEVSFAKVGELIEVNRSVIYSYYKCPSDVLIDFLSRRLDEYIIEIANSRTELNICPIFHIVGLMDLDEEFKSVVSIFFSVLEPAASDDVVFKFRNRLERFIEQLRILTLEDKPDLTNEQYLGYVEQYIVLYLGVCNSYTREKSVFASFGDNLISINNISVCESCMLLFQNTPHYEETKEYWGKVRDIVKNRNQEVVESLKIGN